MNKIFSISLLFVLSVIFVPAGTLKDKDMLIFSQRQWGPVYANYFLTTGAKRATYGPSYIRQTNALWKWQNSQPIK